jgi:hypothetical protein
MHAYVPVCGRLSVHYACRVPAHCVVVTVARVHILMLSTLRPIDILRVVTVYVMDTLVQCAIVGTHCDTAGVYC